MSLKNMTLSSGATIAASGGTALTFADDGVSVANGVHLVVPQDTDYQTRRQATVKYRPPVLNAQTQQYGKDKKSISFVRPILLADGSVVFNTLRIEREVHPSLSAAECTELNKIGSQLLTDSDLDNFWAVGSLS